MEEPAAVLEAILANAPDLITYVGRDHVVRYTNAVPLDTSIRIVGESWLRFQVAEQKETLRSLFETVLATGESASYEGAGHTMHGEPTYYSRRFGAVSRDGEVVGVVIVTRDISRQRATETQLITSDRMASIGSLAAGLAHEINNPLAAVIASLDSATDDVEKLGERAVVPRDLGDALHDARNAAERVRHIVRDLKVFSHPRDEPTEAIDVEPVLESTLRMAWNEIRHRARLERDFQRVPLVRASTSRLGQVFLNLVVNAAQAIPEGDVENNLIRISTKVEGDEWVVVSISDSGSGISDETRTRLFTPFFTTKSPGVGTGLGLSICHRIVTSLGGKIAVVSELGRGTEFEVHLPVAQIGPRPWPDGSIRQEEPR